MNHKNLTVLALAVLTAFAGACAKKEEPAKKEAQGGISISGKIDIDKKLTSKTSANDSIYLIARPAAGGPPVAVIKLMGNSYPMDFKITNADLMMQQDVQDVPINLNVHVDKDGDAMTKAPGDLLGTYDKNPVSLHSENVVITVNEVLK